MSKLSEDFDDVKLMWITDPPAVENFRDRALEATQAIIADRQQSADSFAWQRGSWQELQEKRDGLTYDVQGMGPWMTSLVKMLPAITQEQSDQAWYEAMRDRQLATAATFGLTERRDREMQLGLEPRVGRALAEMVGDDRWSVLMPFRVGYPTAPALPSPRRDPISLMI